MLGCAGCMAAVSCNDDDDNNTVRNHLSEMAGTYRMTEWNSPMAVDYDGNGVSSMNMMSESACYNNSEIRLNENGTFTSTYNSVQIIGGESSCAQSQVTGGTWTRSGNTLTATTTSGGSGANTWTWNGNEGTLSRMQANAQYPSINSTSGAYEYGTGNVNYMYTMQ